MEQEDFVPDYAQISRDIWIQQTYEEIKKRTYLDPLYDAAFKVFLSDEQALISFLNGVFKLEGDNRITAVTIKNTEVNILFPQVKTFRLDIRATTSTGFCINVEMQKAKHSRFIERILVQHSAFMLQSKHEWDQEFFKEPARELTDEERTQRYDLRYEFPPTFAIWICDFHLEKQSGYRGTWAIRNEQGLTLSEKVKYILYDLTQFSKKREEIKTTEDRWLYLLKNAGSSNDLPDFDDSVIAKAIKRLLVGTASEKLLKEQAKNMVMTEEELDYLASLKVRARAEGKAEGLAEGKAEGFAEGRTEGRAEGITEGANSKARETAAKMLAKGKPIDEIAEFTGLAESEILAIKARLAQ